MDMPTIEVVHDYDGYFEGVVRSLLEQKRDAFKHTRIVVEAGPYRPYAVAYSSKEGTLYLDFYSALRAGFGSLSDEEVESLVKIL